MSCADGLNLPFVIIFLEVRDSRVNGMTLPNLTVRGQRNGGVGYVKSDKSFDKNALDTYS